MAKPLREIEVHFTTAPGASEPVGTLAHFERRVFFEYNNAWLGRGLELSPFLLPLQAGLIKHTRHDFGPLFGLFDDSLPDGWGLLLMDRYFRKIGYDPVSISPLERLAFLGTKTMGALTYHPPTDREVSPLLSLDLHLLASQSYKIYQGQASDILPELCRMGGSPGGARPKVLVGYNQSNDQMIAGEDDLPDGFEHWLVKFSAQKDAHDAGPVEYAYATMAQSAGIDMPQNRLFTTSHGGRFFGVKRFDRGKDNRRFHVHTFGNLIQTNFRIPSCDYADLLKATSLLTKNQADVLRVFRLMVFNVLAHNRDDHAKNFAFILDDLSGQWSLAPAYDLTFASGPGGEHSTTLAGEGQAPNNQHILQLAHDFGIKQRTAEGIIKEVKDAVQHWTSFASASGVSPETIKKIATHF